MTRIGLTTAALLAGLAAFTALFQAPASAADEGGSSPRSQPIAGSGTPAVEVRSVAAFQAISSAGAINLRVRQAAREAVQVRADDNLLPLLETVIEADGDTPTLRVRWKRGISARPKGETTVTVDVVTLKAIGATGSGQVTVEQLVTPALKLALSGTGDVRLDALQAGELAVSVAGSGGVRGDGTADRLRLSIAGSGDVRLADLRAEEASVSIAGSGDATLNVRKALKVSIAGSGSVAYVGDPAVSSSIAGSGRVSKR